MELQLFSFKIIDFFYKFELLQLGQFLADFHLVYFEISLKKSIQFEFGVDIKK